MPSPELGGEQPDAVPGRSASAGPLTQPRPDADPSVAAAAGAWSGLFGGGPLRRAMVVGLFACAAVAVLAVAVMIAAEPDGGPAGERADGPARRAPTPARVSATPQPGVERSGRGSALTEQFALAAGDYAIAWRASGSGATCLILLKQSDGPTSQMLVNDLFGGTRDGTDEMFNLPAGTYYFEVDGCTDWSFRVQRKG